jgi:hypothetical protein
MKPVGRGLAMNHPSACVEASPHAGSTAWIMQQANVNRRAGRSPKPSPSAVDVLRARHRFSGTTVAGMEA